MKINVLARIPYHFKAWTNPTLLYITKYSIFYTRLLQILIMYICVCSYISIWMYVFMDLSVYLFVYMHVYIHVYICVRVFVSTCTSPGLAIYMLACTHFSGTQCSIRGKFYSGWLPSSLANLFQNWIDIYSEAKILGK